MNRAILLGPFQTITRKAMGNTRIRLTTIREEKNEKGLTATFKLGSSQGVVSVTQSVLNEVELWFISTKIKEGGTLKVETKFQLQDALNEYSVQTEEMLNNFIQLEREYKTVRGPNVRELMGVVL